MIRRFSPVSNNCLMLSLYLMGSTVTKNFDCTQLVSFDKNIKDHDLLEKFYCFERQGFRVIQDENIKKVKKSYFSHHKKQYFLELFDLDTCADCFSSEFENWNTVENPPYRIVAFVDLLLEIIKSSGMCGVSLYVVNFAQKGILNTLETYCECNNIDVLKNLFYASGRNFESKWENVVVNIL